MKDHYSIFLLIIFMFLMLFLPLHATNICLSSKQDGECWASRIQTYIVHVVAPEGDEFLGEEELESFHRSFLPNATLDSGEPRLIYSYSSPISGFAAKLTAEEVTAMEKMAGFLFATPDVQDELDTSYTPEFLGLSKQNGTWSQFNDTGEGIVIGVLDSGIPRNHSSFGDAQMQKPANWSGSPCNFTNFSCNNKIIGGVKFYGGIRPGEPPVDTGGHGSHVASIAAGNFVNGALEIGDFKYTASGMAPNAYLAIYKVCPDCNRSDLLKAFQQATQDRVHIINLSIGGSPTANFYYDAAAYGAYAAVKNGISVVVSAGNRGPNTTSLSHSAPWLTVVGASTIDRRLGAVVKLGDGTKLAGESGYQPKFNSSVYLPLAYPGENNKVETLYCRNHSLSKINVKGKVVLCWSGINDVGKGREVLAAGGAAMILMNQKAGGSEITYARHVLPVSHLSYDDGVKIRDYYNRYKKLSPNATIVFEGQVPGRRPSPMVYRGSSRGPSLTNGGILKPDVIAPGEEILGAWPYKGGLSNNYFHFDTGTSMAAPHVAGIMALIKNKQPTWSPAAIQSAIITSANDVDLDRKPIVDMKDGREANIFARGAGQVNASQALDPGLVYDRNFDDYIGYMCGLNYDPRTMRLITGNAVNCSAQKKIKASQLNYASIMVNLSSSSNETVERTVTNVGNVNSHYAAMIVHPTGTNVTLSSNILQFSATKPKLSFNVTISIKSPAPAKGMISAGKLEWVSSKKVVRSPIAVVF